MKITKKELQEMVRKCTKQVLQEALQSGGSLNIEKKKSLNEWYDEDDDNEIDSDNEEYADTEDRDKKFRQWEKQTKIPDNVIRVEKNVLKSFGYTFYDINETIYCHNVYGDFNGYAKGFTIARRTSSRENGPEEDNSQLIDQFLNGIGFVKEKPYGDNGLDYTTNTGGDTFMSTSFYYKPTFTFPSDM